MLPGDSGYHTLVKKLTVVPWSSRKRDIAVRINSWAEILSQKEKLAPDTRKLPLPLPLPREVYSGLVHLSFGPTVAPYYYLAWINKVPNVLKNNRTVKSQPCCFDLS